jgi:hypothetical protein
MRRSLVGCLVLSSSLLACGGEPSTPPIEETIEPKLSAIQQHVFIGCATASCHSPTGKAGNLDLTAANAYEKLLGQDGTGAPTDNAEARADGFLRVSPGHPEKSFLLAKVQATVDAKYGARMPTVGDPLTAAQLKALNDWIAAGAKND